MGDALVDFVLGALRNAAAELSGVVLVLALIFVPLAGILYVVIRSLAAQHGANVRFEWNPGTDPQPDGLAATPDKMTNVAASAAHSASPFDQTRRFLADAYRVMVLLAGAGLLIAAVVAFMNATPGNGLLLVALLLVGLSLVVFGTANKFRRAEREEDFLRSALDDLRSKLTVSTSHAPPEVYSLTEAEFARSRDVAPWSVVRRDCVCGQRSIPDLEPGKAASLSAALASRAPSQNRRIGERPGPPARA